MSHSAESPTTSHIDRLPELPAGPGLAAISGARLGNRLGEAIKRRRQERAIATQAAGEQPHLRVADSHPPVSHTDTPPQLPLPPAA